MEVNVAGEEEGLKRVDVLVHQLVVLKCKREHDHNSLLSGSIIWWEDWSLAHTSQL